MTIKMTIINAETNEIVEREMTSDELKNWEQVIAESNLRRDNASTSKQNAKDALLALGLDPIVANQLAGFDD